MGSKLRTYFLTGLVVFAPISITVYLIWAAIDGIDDLVRRILPPSYNPETYLPFSIPGLGVVMAIVFLIVLGALAANFLGRSLIGLGERVVNRMPIVRGIYTTLKQIIETVTARNAQSFREVVLIEYPRPGLWAIAFVAGPTRGEVGRKVPPDSVSVFLPTTPNPTSGFLLFVPRKDCVFLDMGVEEAVKYVISAGLVSAPVASPAAGPGDRVPEPSSN